MSIADREKAFLPDAPLQDVRLLRLLPLLNKLHHAASSRAELRVTGRSMWFASEDMNPIAKLLNLVERVYGAAPAPGHTRRSHPPRIAS